MDEKIEASERLSFKQRRAKRHKSKRDRKSSLLGQISQNEMELEEEELEEEEQEEEKMEMEPELTQPTMTQPEMTLPALPMINDTNNQQDIIQTNMHYNKTEETMVNKNENKMDKKPKKFQVVSNENELEIDPSDIMSQTELINRQIENLLGKKDIKSNNFYFSESYLETGSSKFVKLLSEKYQYDGSDDNGDIITNNNIIYLLQNEIMSIFTLIIGIVEGVILLSLFVVVNNSNTDFLKKFASLLYIIQFLSYIVTILLFPYSFILLYYTQNDDDNNYNNKRINKYQKGLFIICSLSIFIICMMEYPISDEIYYSYSQNNNFFSDEINVNHFSDKLSKWRKYLFAKFSFFSLIWILNISFFHESKPNEKKE